MTLPTTTISMSDVNVELLKSSTAPITLNDTNVRTLAGRSSGTISMGDLRGKTYAVYSRTPGSYNEYAYSTAYFTVSCNVATTWTYTVTGASHSVNYPSGTTSGVISFTVTTPNRFQMREIIINLTATIGGVTMGTWSVSLRAYGEDMEIGAL